MFAWLLSCASHLPASYADVASWPPIEARLGVDGGAPREAWWSWRDHRVHLDVHDPVGPGRGTVVMVHGAGGHGRLLAPFAAPLGQAGFRVVVPDLPGYGLTVVPERARTTVADWSALVADLAASQEGPVALVGLSVGGTVALHAAMRTEVDAVVVTTLLDLQDRDVLRAVARRPGSVGLLERYGRLLGGFRRQVRRLAPLEAMSSDEELVSRLVDDPLIGRRRVRLGFFASFVDAAPPTPPERLDVPLLVAHPAEDAWTSPALSRPTYDRHGGPKAWVDLDGASHLPVESPGYEQLVEAMRAWLQTHLSR